MTLKFEDVYFNYSDEERVLHGISFTLDDPGLVCIIGPNGIGKSTLVKCINKLLKPTEGSILVDGRSVEDYRLKDMAKVVGFVPAGSSDGFAMSVVDTVLMGRHPYQKAGSSKNDLHIVYEVLRELGITHLALRNFNELSAGQHQKVMLARGLAQEPELLLLDEPTSNLDVRHQVQVAELLRELAHRRNMTIVMISHDINISAKYADKIIAMSTPGIIFKIGTPQDVITEDMMRYVYGMNCKIVNDSGRPHVILGEILTDEEISELHIDDDKLIDH